MSESRLHQIRITYDAHEDRVLLRIGTTDAREYRLWLTRRYVAVLWPVLERLLAGDRQVQSQSDPAAREAVMSFQHQQAVERADFSRGYEETPRDYPLGERPLLLARVKVREADGAPPVLCLHPAEGQGVDVAMNPTLLHSFAKLLADACARAEWNLPVGIARIAAAERAPQGRLN